MLRVACLLVLNSGGGYGSGVTFTKHKYGRVGVSSLSLVYDISYNFHYESSRALKIVHLGAY